MKAKSSKFGSLCPLPLRYPYILYTIGIRYYRLLAGQLSWSRTIVNGDSLDIDKQCCDGWLQS